MTITDGHFIIEGELFPPQSSMSTPIRLVINGENYHVDIKHASEKIQGSVKALRIEPAIGDMPRKIYLEGEFLFETYELDKVEKLAGGSFWSGLARTERFGWHIVPLAIATPFLAFGLYRMLIPLLISFGMFMTPDAMLRTIDKNTIKTIDFKLTKATEIDQARQDEIQAIFERLVKTAEAQSDKKRRIPKYKLLFRHSDIIGPNAFALPGGTIVMTDELIEMFPEQDYVLSAVLAHEVGHVDEEHSLRQIYRALGMAAMIGLIAGDAGPMLEDIILEGSALLSLSFSREHEMAADNFSYNLLIDSDMRADGLITFFEKIEEDIKIPESGEWMMTHPLSDKRIENIRSRMEGAETVEG